MNLKKLLHTLVISSVYFFLVSISFGTENLKVLYISSVSLQSPITRKRLTGVMDGLEAKRKVDTNVEFLNSKKYSAGKTHNLIYAALYMKLKDDFNYHGVIVSGDDALHFIKTYYEEFFTEIPIAFFAFEDIEFATEMAEYENIVGIDIENSNKDNLELINNLYPDKKLVILKDATFQGAYEFEKTKELTSESSTIIIDLSKLSWEELPEKLQEVNENPLKINSMFEDKNGETKSFDESFEIVKSNHTGMNFFNYEHSLGNGILGGKLTNHYEYAKDSASFLISIFSGNNYKNTTMITSKNKFIIDYQEMRRLKLSVSQFPLETVFINKPETAWEKYKSKILMILFSLAAAFATIVFLLFQIKAKNNFAAKLFNAKEQLQKTKNELRKIINLIPSHIYIRDSEGRFLLANNSSAESFNMKPEQLQGERHCDLDVKLDELANFMEEDRKIISGEVDEIVRLNDTVTIQNEKRHFQTTKIPYESDTGETVVLGVSTEITQNVLMQKELEKKNKQLITRRQELIDTQKDLIEKLGTIIEHRSKETANHVKRVSKMAKLLAEKLGLDEKEAELIEVAAPMHDVGKIAIKEEILHKAGKLTTEEFEEMKKHPIIGYNLLHGSHREIFQTAAIIAHEHHERWDGTGYPHRKKGEEIHIYGRITSIVDVFDALVTERSYKKAWSLEEAFDFIVSQKSKMFDPQMVDLFVESRDEIEEIKITYMD